MKVLQKYALVIILCVALAVSCVAGIIQHIHLNEYSNNIHNITGTYIDGDSELPAERKYLVFQSDGAYMYYRQFEIIEQGVYETDKGQYETQIITLRREGDNGESQLARMGNMIFYSDRSGVMAVFNRISDVPTYINVGAGATDAATIEPVINEFSTEEVDAAIDCVKKSYNRENCTLDRVWYDKEKSLKEVESYMQSRGSENGVDGSNVIVLLSDITVGDVKASEATDEPNTVKKGWMWILIRDSADGEWRIDDQGY